MDPQDVRTPPIQSDIGSDSGPASQGEQARMIVLK